MKKIVLIILPSPWLISDRDIPNFGILYLASYLRWHNIETQVVDLTGLDEKDWRIPDADVYGISVVTPQFLLAQKVMSILRNRQKKATIIVGGPHISAVPEEVLKDTEANITVMGEGENFLLEYMRSSVLDFDNKKIVNPQLFSNIDFPHPARDLIDIYTYNKLGTNAWVGQVNVESALISSRGCPYNCSYCAQRNISKGVVRLRSMEDLEKEIVYLIDRYNTDRFYFLDDTFNINKERLHEITNLFKKIQKPWHCLGRSNLMTEEIIKEMADSGCVQITYGIESGSDEILTISNKKSTVLDNHNAIQWSLSNNIKVRGQMMVGLPGENKETVKETADFIQEHPNVKWGLHIFTPLPGSPVWKNPEKFNFKIKNQNRYEFYQTIGKPNEWFSHLLHENSNEIKEWADYLHDIIGQNNIYKHDRNYKYE
jgi:radical SAM superfamily enzyme YgiQ (UPF0313 family)